MLTTWLSIPVLLAKLLSPLYVAVTVCVPAANVLVLKEAVVTPLVVLTLIGLPALLPSTWNCIVPVGVLAAAAVALTVAVKVTLCPDTDGLADDTSAVLVLGLLMTVRASTSESGAVLLFPPKA